MQKVMFSTEDILNEFLMRADMKGLSQDAIDITSFIIRKDSFRLIRTIKVIYNDHKTRVKIYMCEWIEDGKKDSDEWLRPWQNFIGAIAHNYIIEAQKIDAED